ncbi:hypothetical protein A2866_00390 [Candidatus Roizmanbacteria bacterium RIFCSPHIGHO2_01_FULL_39_8]|uniref:Uncharacterized protein n=2 Tax=Candidatus Roizmaniibacteriota TaxID=1752723 RepID=A0A1F7GJI0_9BACT|nr:MAG: hypothetical protein A2866_00390 [Candidatus Roizmanbacteria bacterium RIFCSPHIGHO2_01_FULL_39_8]
MIISIPIPDDSACILKKNQSVDFQTPYIERKTHTDSSIAVSTELGIKPDAIFRYLKKFVGDQINKGDVLAEKKVLLGYRKITSEFSGTIKEINHYQGEIVLSITEDTKEKALSYFRGEVEEVTRHHIKLSVKSAKEYELKRASANFGGEAVYVKNQSTNLNAENTADKILVIESLSSYMASKAEALGIKGMITFKDFQEKPAIHLALLKNTADLAKIFSLSLPYCVITKESSKIYFYS